MIHRTRQALFWLGMTNDLKQKAEACDVCQQLKPKNQKETLQPVADGEHPWDRIGLDIFELDHKAYLVIVDYYSGFIELEYLPTTTSKQVITKIKVHCARYGIPRSIISDNGQQFASREFRIFTEKWSIMHTFSAPFHQQANGRAEAAVKTVKTLLRKCRRERCDPYEAMMELRNTPKQDTGYSPPQMLFGRNTRTLIPALTREYNVADREARRAQRKQTVKRWYDK